MILWHSNTNLLPGNNFEVLVTQAEMPFTRVQI